MMHVKAMFMVALRCLYGKVLELRWKGENRRLSLILLRISLTINFMGFL